MSEVDPSQLPSLPQLHRAAAAAVLLGCLVGVTTVLPAEFAVDPTGVGTILGLTAMGELKQGPADPGPPSGGEYIFHVDELTLTLKPNEGAEIKAVMRAGDQLVYEWAGQDGAELFYDFHGEPKGAPSDVFTSFEKGTAAKATGTFEAPFEGVHGWYWKNRTSQRVTVVLNTSGVYRSIERMR